RPDGGENYRYLYKCRSTGKDTVIDDANRTDAPFPPGVGEPLGSASQCLPGVLGFKEHGRNGQRGDYIGNVVHSGGDAGDRNGCHITDTKPSRPVKTSDKDCPEHMK